MKITKVEYHGGNSHLTVYTDAVENVGFNFKIEEIEDAQDLKDKVKDRVDKWRDELDVERGKKERADEFKELEGEEI